MKIDLLTTVTGSPEEEVSSFGFHVETTHPSCSTCGKTPWSRIGLDMPIKKREAVLNLLVSTESTNPTPLNGPKSQRA